MKTLPAMGGEGVLRRVLMTGERIKTYKKMFKIN